MKNSLMTAIIVLSFVSGCAAQKSLPPLAPAGLRWELVVADSNKKKVYVDRESLARTSEGFLEAWIRIEYSEQQKLPSGIRYRLDVARKVFDCQASKFASYGVTLYLDPDMKAYPVQWDPKWSDAVPDSLGEAILQEVCGVARRRGV